MSDIAMMQWVLPCVVIALGLVVGAWVATLRSSKRPVQPDDEGLQADLDESLAHSLAQLRDLEGQRSRLDADAYATQKVEFEARAADLMRQLDRLQKAKPAPKPSVAESTGQGLLARYPQLSGAIWGGLTVGMVAMLYSFVSSDAKVVPPEASPMRPGPTATAPAADGGEVTALLDRLQQDPKDLEALLRLGHLVLRAQRLEEAQALTEQALALDPQNPEALVHQAVLDSAQKGPEHGIEALTALTKKEPTLAEGWFFLGMLTIGRDPEAMRHAFEQFVEHSPPGPQRDRIASMLAGKGLQMPNTGGAMPPGHPPAGGGAMPPGHPPAGSPPPSRPPMAGGRPMAAADGGEVAALRTRLTKDPDDLDALVQLGHKLMRAQQLDEADALTKRALTLQPGHPEARVHAAVLQSARGDHQGAIAGIDAVLDEDPKFSEAWFFRGMLGMQSGNPTLAQESWRQFVAVAPDGPQKTRIRGFLEGRGLQMPSR